MPDRAVCRTLVVPWRKICAALPAVALIGAGVAFAAPFDPEHGIVSIALTKSMPAVVVPDTALTLAGDARRGTSPFQSGLSQEPFLPQGADSAPALTAPKETQPGTSAPVALDSTGIPVRALEAYRTAASAVGAADPACHIDWALLAAFGRVESNHGRFAGNQLDAAGVAQPGIIGIPLDGTNGTTRITDTDGGALDRDTVYDRAVGPMQFIPSTWRAVGVDADGDGVKNPQDMADSVTATAIYVCSGPGDLSVPGDLHAAIMRYNNSDSYARTVTSIAAAYRLSVVALPDVTLLSATAVSPSLAAEAVRIPAATVPERPAVPAPPVRAAPVPVPVPVPMPAPVPAAPALPVSALAPPVPAAPVQPAPVPPVTAPVPAPVTAPVPNPTPTDPCSLITAPTAPTPGGTVPVGPLATLPPCLPQPCLPNPTSPNPTIPIPSPTIPISTQPPTLVTPSSTPGTQQPCTTAPSNPAPTPTP